jgi:hypothetical protein
MIALTPKCHSWVETRRFPRFQAWSIQMYREQRPLDPLYASSAIKRGELPAEDRVWEGRGIAGGCGQNRQRPRSADPYQDTAATSQETRATEKIP